MVNDMFSSIHRVILSELVGLRHLDRRNSRFVLGTFVLDTLSLLTHLNIAEYREGSTDMPRYYCMTDPYRRWPWGKDLTPLSELTALRSLDISSIGLLGLSHLPPSLTSLVMEDAYMGQVSITALSALTNLRHLDMSGCYGGDSTSLDTLSALRGLESLMCAMWWHDWEGTGWEFLTALGGLTRLSMGRCGAEMDVSYLTALTSLRNLEFLYISKDIGPMYGTSRVMSWSFEHASCLSTLTSSLADLERPSPGIASCHRLMPSLSPSLTLFLDPGSRPEDFMQDLSVLTSFTALQRLQLIGHSSLQDMSPLGSLHALEYFNFYGASITDLSPLTHLTRLKTLQMGMLDVRDLSPLSTLTTLHTVHLTLGFCVTDLTPLSTLTRMECLELTDCMSVTSLAPLTSLTRLVTLIVDGYDGTFHLYKRMFKFIDCMIIE